MAVNRYKVANNGSRVRERIGVRFPPAQSLEVEANERQYLTLKAVRDFEVQQIDNAVDNSEQLDLSEMNVQEAYEAVESGSLDVQEAISIEKEGKNRSSLIEKLERMEDEQQSVQEQDGD